MEIFRWTLIKGQRTDERVKAAVAGGVLDVHGSSLDDDDGCRILSTHSSHEARTSITPKESARDSFHDLWMGIPVETTY